MDEAWKNRLSRHLSVLKEEGALDVWDDRRIAAGADWEEEIRAAMDAADVAILLISKDYLTSRFVRDSEVPHLLQRRANEGLRVIPIIVHPCLWKEVGWLRALEVRPRNGKPLSSLDGNRADENLVALVEEVLKPPNHLRAGPPEAAPVLRPPLRSWALGLMVLAVLLTLAAWLFDSVRDEGLGPSDLRPLKPETWIRGRVVDSENRALSEVQISRQDGVPGTVITDVDGRFKLRLTEPQGSRVGLRVERTGSIPEDFYCYAGTNSCSITLEGR